ncbi:MAG: Uncharacterised protein [Crocinitomicaceae bacterium]|nr:MAG: Uncharacterised protein [Crocinitomicaceae bacterium]
MGSPKFIQKSVPAFTIGNGATLTDTSNVSLHPKLFSTITLYRVFCNG